MNVYRYIINADTFHPQKLDPVMYLHIGRISAAKSKDTEQCFKSGSGFRGFLDPDLDPGS